MFDESIDVTSKSSNMFNPSRSYFGWQAAVERQTQTMGVGVVDDESHAPAWRRENREKMTEVPLFQKRDGSADGILWYWVDNGKALIALYNNTKNEKLTVKFDEGNEAALAKPDDDAKKSFRCKVEGSEISFIVLPGEMVLAFDSESRVPSFTPILDPVTSEDYKATYGELEEVYEECLQKVRQLVMSRGINVCDDMAILQACIETGTRFVDINFTREQVMGPEADSPGPFLAPEQFLRLTKDGEKKALFLADDSGKDVSPGDVGQGLLGDCWLIAAIAALAEWPKRVYSLFGVDGNPQYGNEVGGYVINHTKHGIWKRTVVDDFLIIRGVSPMFARNRTHPAELWVPLLEKAWAKVHGGYKNLECGKPNNALTDLTGSPSMVFMFNPEDPSDVLLDGFVKTEFWNRDDLGKALTEWNKSDFAMCIQTPGADTGSFDRQNKDLLGLGQKFKSLGLSPGHCYTLYGVEENDGQLACTIRNPHGKVGEDAKTAMVNFSLQQVSNTFKGGTVTMIRSECDDLRFMGLSSGQASFALNLKNNAANHFSIMASQPDHRGNGSQSGPDLSYAGLQIRLMVKAETGYRLAKKEDVGGQAPACRWRMSRDMGLNINLEPGEYLVTLVTDADSPVVLSIQASGDFNAEAFGVPPEAEWLKKQVEGDATFEIDTSASADVKQQTNKAPLW